MGDATVRLIDCFMPLAAYVVIFQESVLARQPDYNQVKADIQRLVAQSEKLCKKGELPPEDFDQARFAVCAWVDEALLGSGWSHKGLWQREQLQRTYYNTADAGVELFERLNNLGFHNAEIREVFYLCLALGFKGRFIQQGDEFLLEQLKSSNLKLLAGNSGGVPVLEQLELFPEAYPTQAAPLTGEPTPFRFTLVTLLALAGPILLYGLLYLVYRFALSGVAGKIS
jgi:type VI secretion system protein ImpK